MAGVLDTAGRLGPIRVAGEKLEADVVEAVLGSPTFDLTLDQVPQLNLQLHDPDLRLLRSGLFPQGAEVSYGDLQFRLVGVETGGGAAQPTLTLTARDRAAQALRRDRGPLVQRNVSPTAFLDGLVADLGSTLLGEPSAPRTTVARTAPEKGATGEPESTWDLGARLADELGYLWGADGAGTVYFGRPTWLVERTTTWEVRWPRAQAPTEAEPAEVPVCRRNEDASEGVSVDVLLSWQDGADVRPGHALKLAGVPTFDATYLVQSVSVPLTPTQLVSVSASTPADPEPAELDTAAGAAAATGSGAAGAPAKAERPAGVWRGTVTRVSGGEVYVEVPRLAQGHEFGPCDRYLAGMDTVETTVGDHGAHSHGLPALAAGAPVLVAFVEGRRDDPVVVGWRR